MSDSILKVLVIDDVALARQRLDRLLRAYPDVQLVGSCADAPTALNQIDKQRPHLLLLDVAMPECDGFGLLERLDGQARPAVVFTTAHADFAARAFQVRALDYLLKPVAPERLREALDRAWATLRAGRSGPAYLVLRERDQTTVLPMPTIDWVEAAGNYSCIRAQGQTHVYRETLARLETRLDPALFQRIHRSRIVNLSRVLRLLPLSNGDHRVVLQDGSELAMSRTYRDLVFDRLPLSRD